MKIRIIADNYTFDEGFKECWGFSVLINDDILFDTSDSPQTFLNNTEKMNINLKLIKKVIISHDHWDHTGGLEGLLKSNSSLKLYGLKGFSQEFKELASKYKVTLIESEDFQEIEENIFTSGSFETLYKQKRLVEQALVLKTVKGLIIILGCAHPGVVEMTTAIKEHFNEKIYCVLGGYHLGSKKESEIKDIILRFKKLGVYRVAPTHCTGQKAVEMFQKHYQDKFLPLKTGLEVELDF